MLSRSFPMILLAVNGLIYCYIAWLFLLEPASWLSLLAIDLRSAVGYTELRSVYGGFLAAYGLFQLLCLWNRTYVPAGMTLYVMSYAGLVAARSWGIVIDEAYNELILRIYIAEWLALVLGVVALFLMRRR